MRPALITLALGSSLLSSPAHRTALLERLGGEERRHLPHQVSSRSLRVIVVLVLLVIGLLPGAASAEPHSRVPRINSVLDQALGFFAQLWVKIGCGLDPNGLCVSSPSGQSTQDGEIGCGLDPHGHCIESPSAQGTDAQGEIGCELDPSGRCGR